MRGNWWASWAGKLGGHVKFAAGFLVGLCLIECLISGAVPAHAQPATKGTTSASLPANLGAQKNTISLQSVRLTWSFSLLLGEPTYSFTGQYQTPGLLVPGHATIANASVCTPYGPMPSTNSARLSSADLPPDAWSQAMQEVELLSNSLFRVVLVNSTGEPNTRVYLDVRPDSLSRETSETPLSVRASPSWDKVFRMSSGTPSSSDPWLTAEQAKAIFKQGVRVREVQLIEPHFNLSALRKAYDAHLRDTCVSPSAAKTADDKKAADQDKPAEATAASVPPQQSEPGPKSAGTKPQLDMGIFDGNSDDTSGNQKTAVAGQPPATPAPSSASATPSSRGGTATASMLLLIDASGSMQGSRLAEAKRAARDAIRRAASVSGTEFSVASFSGECARPQISVLPFTSNAQAAERFIQSITASGGTPLGPAVSHVNRFMDKNRSASSKTQIIILLADGADSCNDVSDQVARLKREGMLFRHETIGLETDAKTSEQLRQVASASGGGYHHAARAEELAQTFKAATDNIRLLDMLGGFGKSNTKRPDGSHQGGVNWNILSGTSK